MNEKGEILEMSRARAAPCAICASRDCEPDCSTVRHVGKDLKTSVGRAKHPLSSGGLGSAGGAILAARELRE